MNSIIPKPQVVNELSGSNFLLTSDSTISAKQEFCDIAELLASYLRPSTGYALPVTETDGTIEFDITESAVLDAQGFTNESYEIKVTDAKIVITAQNDHGAARAVQTLRQLFDPEILSIEEVAGKKWEIAPVEISDSPKLKWRGSHFDVSRHFMSVDSVKKYIDAIALHRMNIIHLHLTDDQGWRIEIKKYPKLTEVGSKRECSLIGHNQNKPRIFDEEEHSGFFTQEDIKEIVQFAANRRITVLPEIDMPGHMQAAITAYPELGNYGFKPGVRCHWGISQHILNTRETTLDVMRDILGEVIDLFPSTYIHIGGDEALKKEWEESREAQAKMAELGLSDEKELQRWFIKEMRDFIDSKGRRLIGWDEILEGGPLKDTAIMNWHDGAKSAREAAESGNYVVNTHQKFLYLDYYQAPAEEEPLAIGGLTTTEDIYSYNPIPEGLEGSEFLLGSQVQLWTEYMPEMKDLEYMAFPRVCAFSEIAWSDNDKDYNEFLPRLDFHRARLNALKLNSHPKPTAK